VFAECSLIVNTNSAEAGLVVAPAASYLQGMLNWWRARPRRTLAAICFLCTAIVLFLHFGRPVYQRAEEAMRDWLLTNPLASRPPADPRIVYLGKDKVSETLENVDSTELEQSPALQLISQTEPGQAWNRGVYAYILDRLITAGASAVVFDITFSSDREGDEEFAAALEKHKDDVVIGSNLVMVQQIGTEAGDLHNTPYHDVPSPTLLDSAEGQDTRVGFVNVRADEDGVVRGVQYRTSLLEYFGLPQTPESPDLFSLVSRGLQQSGHGDLVPNTKDELRIRYVRDPMSRSLYEIFVDRFWKSPVYKNGEVFRDKIVIVGAAGNDSTDRLTTPHGVMLGPVLHISALDAALRQRFLHPTSPLTDLLSMAIAGALAWILGTIIKRPLRRLITVAGMVLGFFAACQFAANSFDLLPILLSPLLVFTGSSLTWFTWEQAIDRAEKTRIRRTLERYVSKDVVKEVLDNPQSFLNSLNGERRPATVLFSDVRGFTTVTESADPAALVSQLNEYFREMVKIVRIEQRGTLDKFIGDAVMAHWGSIVTEGREADARCAVATALRMREVLARLNEDWRARGMHHFAIGIGVNHGEVIVANLGSDEKMEVSVIGDAVNLASRLEGVTKPYHVDICLGESVASLVRDAFVLRSLDLITVKGKTKPVETFTVLSQRNGSGEPPWLAAHEEATRLYRKGDFTAAEARFREVLAQQPGDGLAELMIERCQALQADPPEGPWTGVYEMKSK
jgi:adenylate cyclase